MDIRKVRVEKLTEALRFAINSTNSEGFLGDTQDDVLSSFAVEVLQAFARGVQQRDALSGRIKPNGDPWVWDTKQQELAPQAPVSPTRVYACVEATCEFIYKRNQIRIWRSVDVIGDLSSTTDIEELRAASEAEDVSVAMFVARLCTLPRMAAIQNIDLQDPLKRGQVVYIEWP